MQKKAKADVVPVRQRTQYSCVAASLTMALKSLGVRCSEDEVGAVMGVAPMRGATWEDCIAAAQHYGCQATLVCPATVTQVKEWTDAGDPVIIAWNPEGREWSHASLVFDVVDDVLYIADPNIPNPEETVRKVSKDEFYQKWAEKWPRYLVRRPAMRIRREISPEGRQLLASEKTMSKQANRLPRRDSSPEIRSAIEAYLPKMVKSVKGPNRPSHVDDFDGIVQWDLSDSAMRTFSPDQSASLQLTVDPISEIASIRAWKGRQQVERNEYLSGDFRKDLKMVQTMVDKAVQAAASGKWRMATEQGLSAEDYESLLATDKVHLASTEEMERLLSARFEEGEDVSDEEMLKHLGPEDYAKWVKNREKYDDKFKKKASLPVRKLSEVLKRGDRSFDSILSAVLQQDVAEDIEYAIRNLRPRQVETLGIILESGVPHNVGELMSDLGTQRGVAKMLLRGISRLSGRTAKFEKGKEMSAEDVAKYLRENGAPEAADKWLAEHQKNKDKFKKASKSVTDIVKRLDRYGHMGDILDDRRFGDDFWRMVQHGEDSIVTEDLEKADKLGLLDWVWFAFEDGRISSSSLKDDVLILADRINSRRFGKKYLWEKTLGDRMWRGASKRTRITSRVAAAETKTASAKLTSDLLMRTFRDLDLPTARKMVAAFNSEKSKVDEILRMANDTLGAYGVETIQDESLNTVAWYVNAGDANRTTLFYDTREKDFYLAKWGSWVENFERKGNKVKIASDSDELEWM